jgi:hypothetical protein
MFLFHQQNARGAILNKSDCSTNLAITIKDIQARTVLPLADDFGIERLSRADAVAERTGRLLFELSRARGGHEAAVDRRWTTEHVDRVFMQGVDQVRSTERSAPALSPKLSEISQAEGVISMKHVWTNTSRTKRAAPVLKAPNVDHAAGRVLYTGADLFQDFDRTHLLP